VIKFIKVHVDLNFHFEGIDKFFIFFGIRQLKNLDRKLITFLIEGALDFTKSS